MKMKKLLIMLFCVIIASLGIMLTGCGNSSDDNDTEIDGSMYEGKWAAGIVEVEGVEYNAEDLMASIEFTFNADATGTYIVNGEQLDIKWEPTEDGLKFDDGGSSDNNLAYQDGKLLWEIELSQGLATVYLEKEDSSDDNAAESNSANSEDNSYVGTWELKTAEFNGEKVEGDELIEIMGVVTFIIYDDGTATYMIDDESSSGDWVVTEDGGVYKENGVTDYPFVYKDGMLVMTVEVDQGVVNEYYVKKNQLALPHYKRGCSAKAIPAFREFYG